MGSTKPKAIQQQTGARGSRKPQAKFLADGSLIKPGRRQLRQKLLGWASTLEPPAFQHRPNRLEGAQALVQGKMQSQGLKPAGSQFGLFSDAP